VRIIFFAGKGGVGKTSVAAATGIKVAEMGRKTMLMSLDVAHSLSDIFDLERDLLDKNKGAPVKVCENLWIQEMDIQEEIEKNWGDIHKYLSLLLNTTGIDDVLAEELAILPGMEEVSLLLYINRYAREKEFDVILLDCAPTGESLRFISIPTTLEWYINKIFKMEKTIAKYIRPFASRIYDVPIPDNDYFDAIEFLFNRLRGVDEILLDHDTTSVRLITNPEKIVLKETQRIYMYFCLYRMNIDSIIMNRILPDNLNETFFQDWMKMQKQYVKLTEEYFSPIPVFPVNLLKGEVLGHEKLKGLADEIYGKRNPTDLFFRGEPYHLNKEAGGYQLMIKLPFLMKKDIELTKLADELIVRVGAFKRHLPLPRQVAASKSITAKMDGQLLYIHFKGEDND